MSARPSRLVIRKTTIAQLVAQLFVGGMMVGTVMPASAASCTWNPATGNWAAAANWLTCATGNGNPASTPGASDSATIAAAKTVTINTGQSILTLSNAGAINIDAFGLNLVGGGSTTNTGTINVGGPTTANIGVSGGHNINNTGGTINIAGGSVINQFGSTITGGTINTTGTGRLVAFNNNSNILSGVTFNGNLDLATGTGVERVTGGLVLNGTVNINNNSVLSFIGDQTLGGTGTIVLGNTGGSNRALSLEGNTALTIGSGVVVRGENGTIGQAYLAGGTQSLINNGRISADVSGGSISLAPTNGTTNNGVLEAQNGGTLVLNSNVVGALSGSIVAGAGSTVLQNGVTLSGVINSSGTGNFRVSNNNSNILDGVSFNGPLDLASATSVERVVNGLTLNGTINVNANSVLSFNGDQTLGGNGSIVLGNTGASNRALSLEGNVVLTVGSGVTVRGENGTIGQAYLSGGTQSIINNGSILADVGGGTVALATGLTQNNALLGAANGGTLRLDGAVTQAGAGQINAANASTVLQNGVTITGGVLNTSGTGRVTASNSNSNILSGVTVNGLLDLATATGVERVVGGLTLGSSGTVSVNSNSVLSFNGNQTLGGTGTVLLGNTGASNRALSLEGNTTLTIASGVTVRGVNGTLGQVYLSGGTQALVNNGTINSDGGGTITIAAPLVNNGLVRAQAGTINVSTVLTGTGTLQIDATGVMNLSAGAKTQGTLAMGAAGAAINLNTGNLTLNTDYTNVGAGSGNTFNRRAGVTGTGLIVVGGDAAQAITGANVTNGNTTNATLTIGNVRVGATSFDYQVANTGTTGPSLRGAIQTNVNGALLNDARLTGTGVTPGNYNTGAPGGNTGNLAVTFNAASAGALAPLAGQVLNLRSNFDNIADQKLNIVLGSGAAAYNAAAGAAAPSPVQVANQRVNGTTTAVLTVSNTAAAGLFSEDLNASFGASTGAASGTGGITGRLAGLANTNTGTGAMTVAVNTGSAGAKTGTVSIDYQTAGAVAGVSNGLGTASVGNQTITVNGNVFRLATGDATPAPLDLGNFRLTAATASGSLNVKNTAANDGSSEQLGIQSVTSNNALFTAANTLGATRINAQATANGAVTVGLGTGLAAGVNSGSVNIQYLSDGTLFGTGGATNSNLQSNVGVKATGFNLASGNATAAGSVNLGNFHVSLPGGAAPQSVALDIKNQAPAAFSEQLKVGSATIDNAAFTLANNIGSGLVNAQSTFNNALNVSRTGGVAGVNTGTVTIQYQSDGSNTSGFSAINSNSQNNISVNALGYNLAQSSVITPINLGVRHVGDNGGSVSQSIAISNVAAAGAFTEGLNSSFGSYTGNGGTLTPTFSGSITNLLAGAGPNTNMSVTLSTLAAGSVNGNINIIQASNGAISGLGNTALADQNPAVSGSVTFTVTNLAVARINNSQPITFGNVRQGAVLAAQTVSVTNAAPVSAFSEGLIGSAVGSTGTGIIAAGGFGSVGNSLAPGQTNPGFPLGSGSITVNIDTASAGAKSGNAVLNFKSDGTAFSGGVVTDLGNTNVAVTGNVFRLATGAATPAPLDLGNFRLTAPTASGSLNVKNTAASDGSSEQLGIQSAISTSTLFTAANSLGATRINAQNTANGAVTVGLGTGLAAGVNNGSVNIQYLSDGAVSGTGGAINSNLQNVSLIASGYRLANPTLNTPTVTIAARVNDPVAANQAVSITNTSADAFTEGLKVSVGAISGNAQSNGVGIANLVAQGTSNGAILVGLNSTAASGLTSGQVTLKLASTGAGTTGATTDVDLGTQTVTVNGKVYTTAVGELVTTVVDFGIVRMGDTVNAKNITVRNSAAMTALTLNDTVRANLSGIAGPFTPGSSVAGITAGNGIGSIAVGLDTTMAGISNQTGTVSLLSQDADLADVSAGADAHVSIHAQINRLANAHFGLFAGAGVLTQSGNVFTLDLGNIFLGSSNLLKLRLDNNVSGPADDLSRGLFNLAGANDFTLNGWGPVGTLAAGQASGDLDVGYLASMLGAFTDTIDFGGFSTNASDLAGIAQRRELVIHANVINNSNTVPEPGTLALLLLAAASAVLARRRRTMAN